MDVIIYINTELMNKLKINKEITLSTLFIISCLIIYSIFPAVGIFQKILTSLFFFVFIPFLYIKFILKKSLRNFGFSLGDRREGIKWGIISIVISLLGVFLLINVFSLEQKYVLPRSVVDNFSYFLFYEFLIVFFVSFIYDFFFKGFIFYIYREKISVYAVLVQFFVFLLFLFFNKSLNWNFAFYILYSIPGSFIVNKSNSLLYSLIAQSVVIFAADVTIIKLLS